MERATIIILVLIILTGALGTVFALIAISSARRLLIESGDEPVPAGALIRAAAFYIDIYLWNILFLILLSVSSFIEAVGIGFGRTAFVGIYSFVWLFPLYFSAPYLWKGQTPGKLLAGIAVERITGEPIGWIQAIWRTVLLVLYSFCSLFFLIDFIMIAVMGEKRSTRDFLSGTHIRQTRLPHPMFVIMPVTLAIVAVVLVFGVIRPCFFQAFYIPSRSMEPTLQSGDRLVANKLYYHLQPVRRGDLVIFPLPDTIDIPGSSVPLPKAYYIKRVIGLPNDSILIRGNAGVFVNGKQLHYTRSIPEADWPSSGKAYTVPTRCCFLLGDNLNNSFDSRFWWSKKTGQIAPAIPLGNITGRVSAIFWPMTRSGPVR